MEKRGEDPPEALRPVYHPNGETDPPRSAEKALEIGTDKGQNGTADPVKWDKKEAKRP